MVSEYEPEKMGVALMESPKLQRNRHCHVAEAASLLLPRLHCAALCNWHIKTFKVD